MSFAFQTARIERVGTTGQAFRVTYNGQTKLVRTASRRRYILVAWHGHSVTIVKRSDSYPTIAQYQRRWNLRAGATAPGLVIDTLEGGFTRSSLSDPGQHSVVTEYDYQQIS